MFSADLRNEWLTGGTLGSNTYAVTAAAPIYSGILSLSDGQCLTSAVINMGVSNGSNSVTFGLQEGSSSLSTGVWTPITDANASITLSAVGNNTIGVITGQRALEYCRVAIQASNSDTINCCIVLHDVRTQMPHGASGSSRSPAIGTPIVQ
jgi:hypothetical protein